MNKRKAGTVLGVLSLLPLLISILFFYNQRGPNADISMFITLYGILAIIGIIFTITSWVMSKRKIFLVIGLLGNSLLLAMTYLLLLAMGISEP